MILVKFRLKPSVANLGGGHRIVQVFVGPDGDHLACAGDITLRTEEWEEMQDMAEPDLGFVASTFDDSTLGLGKRLRGVEFRIEPRKPQESQEPVSIPDDATLDRLRASGLTDHEIYALGKRAEKPQEPQERTESDDGLYIGPIRHSESLARSKAGCWCADCQRREAAE